MAKTSFHFNIIGNCEVTNTGEKGETGSQGQKGEPGPPGLDGKCFDNLFI